LTHNDLARNNQKLRIIASSLGSITCLGKVPVVAEEVDTVVVAEWDAVMMVEVVGNTEGQDEAVVDAVMLTEVVEDTEAEDEAVAVAAEEVDFVVVVEDVEVAFQSMYEYSGMQGTKHLLDIMTNTLQ
jgi:hypothetical protein